MSTAYEGWRALLDGRRLPAALIDLAALEANVDRLGGAIAGSGKTLRVASKSVRHTGLLRRILARGGDAFRGLMCYSAEEAAFLAADGFDDLLVAYPTVQREALAALAGVAARGGTVWCVVDCIEHLQALDAAGRAAGCAQSAVLEVDVSLRRLGGRVHLGVRRSPLRDARDAVALARAGRDLPGVRVVGVMGYEAHVAGLPDENPFSRAMNPVRRALKRVAVPAVARLRAEVVEALLADGHAITLVNGGGTGSAALTAREPVVTEVTAGSGFVCPHLFDYYADLDLQPAALFALEVCRISDRGTHVTCAGGGYVASGEPGWDRLPVPWAPAGLRYVGLEGAGEVQTPLLLPPGAPALRVGDPVLFRHAKAGELAERFAEYLLVRDGAVIGVEPTYRGQGQCFG